MKNSYPKVYLYQRIVKAKLFIDSHFSDPIDLNNIAGEAFFSKFHFIRLFKTAYSFTPHQYLIKVRIENAKQFLQKGNSITAVCFAVGFNSISSFSGLFKRLSGVSPSEYQQQCKTRQELIKNAPLKFIPACFAEKGYINYR